MSAPNPSRAAAGPPQARPDPPGGLIAVPGERGVLVIALPERVTMSEAKATLARLQPLLAAADEPVIDASALQELDSAAVALLLDCQRQAQARGKTLRVMGAPAKLSLLAQLYGVALLLGL